jgi:hypothetical protein
MKRSIPVMITLAFVIGGKTLSDGAESDTSAVVAVVKNLFSDVNKNDIAGASVLFVEQPSVTDAFPPFYWHGTTAFKEWMADFATDSTKHKYTDFDFMVQKPLSQEVDGDRANVVVPVVVDIKERSKPVRYNGLANVVLLKTGDIWKIVAFTWTTK